MKYNDIKLIAQLGYFAGIIDGEGCIGIEHLSPCKNRKKSYYSCRLVVVNTDKYLIERLVSFFGGSYSARKPIENRKICYVWRIFGKDLENTLNKLLDHLFIKKEQARILLKYRETVGKTGWNITDEVLAKRKELWLACKKLNSGS